MALAVNPTTTLRVLHVHSGNMYGGVETMLLTQVWQRSLCPAMETSFALCFTERFSEELSAAGAPIHQLGAVRIRQPLSVRRARRNLNALLRQKRFDAVVTHSCWSQAIFGPTIRATGVPLVFYLHAPPDGQHWLERLARRTVPDLVLCNSKFSASTLHKLYPDVRFEIVYCPVAPPTHRFSEANRRLIRAELETPQDATVIIQVSRMEAWKGHAQHLEALGLLKDLQGWVCWQVGGVQAPSEKEYVQELKETAKRLGIADRVRFLGQRRDVSRLLEAADFFCQPNTGPEPFGIVFVEALNARLPVVTTDTGAAREVVDDSCGVLVTPGDAHLLATVLRRLIQEPSVRSELGEAGPARAYTLCDPFAQLNHFQKALGSLIRQRQVSA